MTYVVLSQAPKRLWRGKARLGRDAYLVRNLAWTLQLKVGDYVATCEGHNRKVAELRFHWRNEGVSRRRRPNRTWYLSEVEVIDSRGRYHTCPGCVWLKETPERVTAYFKGWIEELARSEAEGVEFQLGEDGAARLRAMATALDAGQPIVDEFGELLPAFDYPLRGL